MSYQTIVRTGSANLANNQSVPVNITGLIIDPTLTRNYYFTYSIVRRGYTGGNITFKGSIGGRYNAIFPSWLPKLFTELAATTGITLIQLASGQFQYTSTNLSGTPTYDKISWTLKTF